MRADEFKEILESIETGLWGKWLNNFINDPINKGDFGFFNKSANHELIDDAFFWHETSEGTEFWEDVNKKYCEERDKRNLD